MDGGIRCKQLYKLRDSMRLHGLLIDLLEQKLLIFWNQHSQYWLTDNRVVNNYTVLNTGVSLRDLR